MHGITRRGTLKDWVTSVARSALVLTALVASARLAYGQSPPNCHIGSYRLRDGTLVDIAPSDPGVLRWRTLEGDTGALHRRSGREWISTYGWTPRKDGKVVRFSACEHGTIDFDGISGKRIRFEVRNVTFESGGTALAGRLVMPAGKGKVPVIVLIHGSEHDSALDTYFLQRMLPAE